MERVHKELKMSTGEPQTLSNTLQIHIGRHLNYEGKHMETRKCIGQIKKRQKIQT